MDATEQALQDHLVQATKVIEEQVDAEINRLEQLDDDELELIRQRRLDNMKKASKQREEWIHSGHGRYFEVADEKDFFAECKRSKNVVCHFYRNITDRCKIVDKHMEILARKHIETKFIKINAEKCQFLIERLRIKVMPTICIARDGKTIDFIVGFTELGNTDEFTTDMLEWRIARADVLNYQGDLLNPPGSGREKKIVLGYQERKRAIQGRAEDDSSDENGW